MAITFITTQAGASADYVKYLFGEPVKTTTKKDPSLLDFSLAKHGTGFVRLNRGAYITLNSTLYPKWFTGYVTNDPELTMLASSGDQVIWGYKYQATSDEYVLNLKTIGLIPPFMNVTAGEIYRRVVAHLDPAGQFNLDGVEEGAFMPLYTIEPDKKFSDVVKDLCDASSFQSRAVDHKLYFSSQSTEDPIILDGDDTHFTPSRLTIKPSSSPIINDATVLGELEPRAHVHEYFVGTGLDASFPLISTVYGADTSVLLDEQFSGDEIDTNVWVVNDTPDDYLQVDNGYLNILGGIGGLAINLESVNPIPLEGRLRLTHGEWDFISGSGVIGSLWDGATCRYGLNISGTTLQVQLNGVTDSQSMTIDYSKRYIIRTVAEFSNSHRFENKYSYLDADGERVEIGGGSTACESLWTTIITEVDPTDGSITNQFRWRSSGTMTPAFMKYVPVASSNLHATVTNITISVPINATLELAHKVPVENDSFDTWVDGRPKGWVNAVNAWEEAVYSNSGSALKLDPGAEQEAYVGQFVDHLLETGKEYTVVCRLRKINSTVAGSIRIYLQSEDNTFSTTGLTVAHGSIPNLDYATFSGKICDRLTAVPERLFLNVQVNGTTVNHRDAFFVDDLVLLSEYRQEMIGPNDLDASDGLTPVGTIVGGNTGADTKSTMTGSGQFNPGQSSLVFFKDSLTRTSNIPPKDQIIRLSYRSAGSAAGRATNEASVTAEAATWGDDGYRSVVRTDLTPRPRNSRECELAAAALVQENSFTHYEGTYEQFSDFTGGEPVPGQVFQFSNINDITDSSEEVTQVQTTLILTKTKELFNHVITFGRSDLAQRLLNKFSSPMSKFQKSGNAPIVPIDAVLPSTVMYAPDVTSPTLLWWDSNSIYLDTGQDLGSTGFCFECRSTDNGWGANDGKNLIVRSTTRTITIPRTVRGRVVFIRRVNEDIDGNYGGSFSRFPAVVRVSFPAAEVAELAPDADDILSATGEFRYVDPKDGKIEKLALFGTYEPPASISNFSGVQIYYEKSAQSTKTPMKLGDGVKLDSTAGTVGEWKYEKGPRIAHTDGTWVIPDLTPVKVQSKSRVYFCSINIDGKENPLVQADQPGETPSVLITVEPLSVSLGEATRYGPLAKNLILTDTTPFDNPYVSVVDGAVQQWSVSITWENDTADSRFDLLEGYKVILVDDDENETVEAVVGRNDTTISIGPFTVRPENSGYSIRLLSFSKEGTNKYGPGITPEVTFDVDPVVGPAGTEWCDVVTNFTVGIPRYEANGRGHKSLIIPVTWAKPLDSRYGGVTLYFYYEEDGRVVAATGQCFGTSTELNLNNFPSETVSWTLRALSVDKKNQENTYVDGITPEDTFDVPAPPLGAAGIEYAPLASGLLKLSTEGYTAGVKYDLQDGSDIIYGLGVQWDAPDLIEDPELGGWDIDIEYSDGRVVESAGSISANSDAVWRSGLWPLLTDGATFTLYLVSWDVSGRRNSVVADLTPSVSVTVARPSGGPGLEYAAAVTGLAIGTPVYVLNADGQRVYKIPVTWTDPVGDPRFAGGVVYLDSGGGFIPASSYHRGGVTLELSTFPTASTTWGFQVRSEDTNKRRNTYVSGVTPAATRAVAPPADGATGSEKAPKGVNFRLNNTTPYVSGIRYILQEGGDYLYGISVLWDSPSIATNPEIGGWDIFIEYSDGRLEPAGSKSVNDTPRWDSDQWPLPSGGGTFKIRLVTYDTNNRSNSVLNSPFVTVTVAKPVGGAGAENTANVTSFNVGTFTYVANGQGQKVAVATVTWTNPVDARYGGIIIYADGPGFTRKQMSGLETNNSVTLEIGGYPYAVETWVFYAVAQDTNNHPNTVNTSALVAGTFESVSIGGPPSNGAGQEYTSLVTQSGSTPFASIQARVITDGGVSWTEWRLGLTWVAPNDPTFGGVKVTTLRTSPTTEYIGEKRLSISETSAVTNWQSAKPGEIYTVYLQSLDVNGRENSITPGVTPTTAGLTVTSSTPAQNIDAAYLYGDIPVAAFAAALIPPEIVSSVPTGPALAGYADGRLITVATDGYKLYRKVSGVFTKAVDAVDLINANVIVAGSVAAGAIGTSQLTTTELLIGGGTGKAPRFRVVDASAGDVAYIGIASIVTANDFAGIWTKRLKVSPLISSTSPRIELNGSVLEIVGASISVTGGSHTTTIDPTNGFKISFAGGTSDVRVANGGLSVYNTGGTRYGAVTDLGFQSQNNGATSQSSVGPTGFSFTTSGVTKLSINTASLTAVSASTGAIPYPSQLAGFIVAVLNNTTIKIPYYNN